MSGAADGCNRRWILDRRPGPSVAGDPLRLDIEPIPVPEHDELLVRNIYLSIDPTHRIWMSDVEQYMPPVALGDVMRGITLGVVEKSTTEGYRPGDLVIGQGGWQDYHVTKARALSRVEAAPDVPLVTYLGPLGNIGATAYFGLFEIGRPRPGETVVVSAAAGAVGSLVGQMAKLTGCRVVGIVGSDEKAEWITNELGLDAAINYKNTNVLQSLRSACPEGIDLYFDNVGGDILDAALTLVNVNARVVVCGLISTYGNIEEGGGPRMFRNVLMKRLRVEGFIVSDYRKRYSEAFAAIRHWMNIGLLKYRVEVKDGLENAPDVLRLLFSGLHQGKLVVKISPEPAAS